MRKYSTGSNKKIARTRSISSRVEITTFVANRQCFINTFKTHKFIAFIFKKKIYIYIRRLLSSFLLLILDLILNLCLRKKQPLLSVFASTLLKWAIRPETWLACRGTWTSFTTYRGYREFFDYCKNLISFVGTNGCDHRKEEHDEEMVLLDDFTNGTLMGMFQFSGFRTA